MTVPIILTGYMKDGRYIKPQEGGGFTDAFVVEPDWIKSFMASFPFKQLSFFGAENMFAQSEELLRQSSPEVLTR
jgi:hypothetical protein